MFRKLMGLGAVAVLSGVVFGQSPAAAPQFEVASIKPAEPQADGRMMVRLGGDPGRVNYTNVSLKDVLQRAYGVKRPQITGPAWLESDRFNIVAKIPDGVSNDQVPAMLQALLVDRFKLTVRREKKDMPVYALVVGKNGLKLEKAEEDAPGVTAPGPAEGGRVVRGPGLMITNGRMEAKSVTLGRFSDMLSNMMDRPVMDETGIQGTYNFALDVAMEDLVMMRGMARPGAVMIGGPEGHPGPRPDGGPAPEGAPGQSIFSAIQKLGLKLEPRKAPLDFIVIEKGERVPTEN
jgi:uncharacterized protein (TIGR03435 family)